MSSGVCNQVNLKPACSPTKTSWSLEILDVVSIGTITSRQRKKGADQIVQMHRLICTIVVSIWHKTRFLMAWLMAVFNSVALT